MSDIYDAIDQACEQARELLKKHKKVRMAMEPQPDGSVQFIVEPVKSKKPKSRKNKAARKRRTASKSNKSQPDDAIQHPLGGDLELGDY